MLEVERMPSKFNLVYGINPKIVGKVLIRIEIAKEKAR